MPSAHTVLTEHRTEDGDQVTTKTVDLADGPTVTFTGPPGGPYAYDGKGEPPVEALRALEAAVDDATIAHDVPVADQAASGEQATQQGQQPAANVDATEPPANERGQ